MERPDNEPARPAAALQRVGRYRIVRPLSKGGMALVYEARRESLAGVSPRVAIKLILPEHAGSETFRDLFINEARLGSSMHHQNLVGIQDFDAEGDTYYLVMEYVEGLTLRRIISLCERAQIRIPVGVIAELGRQACDGLHYAHTAKDEQKRDLKLVHRDIKPSNLILNPHGVVKVLDFGISKGRLREEKKGSVKGTWGYMAPEQSIGADVGPTADVFGLAVVLYELASLRPMFQDQGKDEIRRLLRDDHAARMAATLDGSAYGPLIGVLVRALQRDPAARYDSAGAFGRALSALLPDPITARDEVTKFFKEIEAMDRGARVTGNRSPGPASHPSLAAAPRTRPESKLGGVAAVVAAATVSVALLGGLAVLGLAFVGTSITQPTASIPTVAIAAGTPAVAEAPPPAPTLAAEEPSGPAGEDAPGEERPPPTVRRGERKPPSASPSVAAPAPGGTASGGAPDEASVRIDRSTETAPEPGTPAPPKADGPTGSVVIDARQPAEVYIDGRFLAATPARAELPEGRYAVALVAADGRRRTFDVDIVAGQKQKKTWDFDRMEWR